MIKMNDDIERLRFMKDAGRVKRMHVNRGPDHTVDEHIYGVSVIIVLLHPHPSAELLSAAILHDMPERITGDIPAPVKWKNPEISAFLHEMEHRVFNNVLGYDPISYLTTSDREWLKAADSFDLWLTACDFLFLGHTFCRDYMDALERNVLNNSQHMTPEPIENMWRELAQDVSIWANATKEISNEC